STKIDNVRASTCLIMINPSPLPKDFQEEVALPEAYPFCYVALLGSHRPFQLTGSNSTPLRLIYRQKSIHSKRTNAQSRSGSLGVSPSIACAGRVPWKSLWQDLKLPVSI